MTLDYLNLVAEDACLVSKKLHRASIFESIRDLLDVPLTSDAAINVSWRLAGNVKKLAQNKPAWKWISQTESEWMPLSIIKTAQTSKVKKDKIGQVISTQRGVRFTIRVLAGSACPLILEKFWSNEVCRVVSKRFGFAWSTKAPNIGSVTKLNTFPLLDPSEFFKLRFYGLFTPESCEKRLNFVKIYCPGSHLKHNREVIASRRSHTRLCPQMYPTSFHCHKCPIGLVSCKNATHTNTYEYRFCGTCTVESAFDDSVSTTICLNCLAKL